MKLGFDEMIEMIFFKYSRNISKNNILILRVVERR